MSIGPHGDAVVSSLRGRHSVCGGVLLRRRQQFTVYRRGKTRLLHTRTDRNRNRTRGRPSSVVRSSCFRFMLVIAAWLRLALGLLRECALRGVGIVTELRGKECQDRL